MDEHAAAVCRNYRMPERLFAVAEVCNERS